jgi:hypothetical protein
MAAATAAGGEGNGGAAREAAAWAWGVKKGGGRAGGGVFGGRAGGGNEGGRVLGRSSDLSNEVLVGWLGLGIYEIPPTSTDGGDSFLTRGEAGPHFSRWLRPPGWVAATWRHGWCARAGRFDDRPRFLRLCPSTVTGQCQIPYADQVGGYHASHTPAPGIWAGLVVRVIFCFLLYFPFLFFFLFLFLFFFHFFSFLRFNF